MANEMTKKIIKRMTKKRVLFLSSLLLIGLCALIGVRVFCNYRLPLYSGTLKLSGLSEEVRVTRDKWGVPHIEAAHERDAYRALGFVMAGDRLFQMDILRRIVNGELSEVFGKSTLSFDILLRKLRLRKHMSAVWKENRHKQSPEMVSFMEAFLGGIHHYMETRPLPLEFTLLGYRPRPFSLEECMGMSGYLALSFAEGLISDALYSDLKDELPKEVLDLMWVREKNDRQSLMKTSLRGRGEGKFKVEKSKWFSNFLLAHSFFRDSFSLFHGSNSWVLSPKRSLSGGALLGNDPHVAFASPGVWYEAHIKTPTFEIYGHYVPLIPFPALGHNRKKAWAITMSEVDDLDLYEEVVNKERTQIMYRNSWRKLESYEEVIKVRGDRDQVITVEVGPHGPLLNDTQYGVEDKDIALKWSYHHPENNVAEAFYKLSSLSELSGLNEALENAAAPGINVSWVDAKGNIAWKVMGKIPYRKGFSGHQILPGDKGEFEYERYFTIDENPGLINPESGVIVTANYRPLYSGKLPLDGYWQPSGRYERIYDLIAERKKWSLKEMMKIQNDQFSVGGKEIRDILLSPVRARNPREERILSLFKKWDGESPLKSLGSTLYYMWIYQLNKLALLDELGEKRYEAYYKIGDSWNFFKSFIVDKENLLWDDKRTVQREQRDDLIRKSFSLTLETLEKKLGKDIKNWTWGKLHTLEFEHPLGKVFPLNRIFNLGPYPVGGASFQINNMSTIRYEDSFKVKLGPSTRRLIDYAQPQKSLGILPTGNVGHVNSSFYSDQVALFLKGKYREQWLDLEDVKKFEHHILTLMP